MAKNILIVGDDRDIHVILSQALTRHGFQVSTLPDSTSATLPADLADTDLLIFDSLEPNSAGWSALPRIRQSSTVPIIALTNAPISEIRVASLDRGADYCLEKPCNLGELRARIRALLRRRSVNG